MSFPKIDREASPKTARKLIAKQAPNRPEIDRKASPKPPGNRLQIPRIPGLHFLLKCVRIAKNCDITKHFAKGGAYG